MAAQMLVPVLHVMWLHGHHEHAVQPVSTVVSVSDRDAFMGSHHHHNPHHADTCPICQLLITGHVDTVSTAPIRLLQFALVNQDVLPPVVTQYSIQLPDALSSRAPPLQG